MKKKLRSVRRFSRVRDRRLDVDFRQYFDIVGVVIRKLPAGAMPPCGL